MRRFFVAALFVGLAAAPVVADEPKPNDNGAKTKSALDQAVDSALTFLASTQDREGAWSAGYRGQNPAITALVVMAFMSAGNVPGEGQYGKTVKRGIEFVLAAQAPNGLIASEGHYEMYQHGICTLMLAEAVGMTDGKLGETVKSKLEKAVQIILRARRKTGYHKGGWRYRVQGDDGDISVTGWQLMALRAAKNVGCDVPPEAVENAVEFIKRCHDPYNTGGYRYLPARK